MAAQGYWGHLHKGVSVPSEKPPDPGGGVGDAILNFFFNLGLSFGPNPVPVAGTFQNGTTPGSWTSGPGQSTMNSIWGSGRYRIEFDFLLYSLSQVSVYFTKNVFFPSEFIEIYRGTPGDGGHRIQYEIIVVDVLQVALPIKIWELTGNGSIVGTAKFIWDPPDS